MSSLTMFRKNRSASNMAKLLFGVFIGVIITPVQADESKSLEERLEQLEQRVIDNEKWLANVGRIASGYEKSWTMSDVSEKGLTIVKKYYGHIAYSLVDIKPFGSGAEVSIRLINMQSVDFTNLEVELHVCNVSSSDPFEKGRKEEVVKSTIPLAKAGTGVIHNIRVKMPPSSIKEWGLMIDEWKALRYALDN